jgi:hypothetical protein
MDESQQSHSKSPLRECQFMCSKNMEAWFESTVFLSDINGMLRFLQVRASHHELLAAHVPCTLDDIIQIIFMDLFTMIIPFEYWITQVDPNLGFQDDASWSAFWLWKQPGCENTYIHIS